MHPIRSARQWARGRSSHVPAFVVLVAMGVLVFTGELTRLNSELLRTLEGAGVDFFSA